MNDEWDSGAWRQAATYPWFDSVGLTWTDLDWVGLALKPQSRTPVSQHDGTQMGNAKSGMPGGSGMHPVIRRSARESYTNA